MCVHIQERIANRGHMLTTGRTAARLGRVDQSRRPGWPDRPGPLQHQPGRRVDLPPQYDIKSSSDSRGHASSIEDC